MSARTLPPDRGWMGDPKRGAGIGRPTCNPTCYPLRKFYLERVRINSQGYDSSGAYWGTGEPLYWAHDYPATHECFVRGATRAAAKEAVRQTFPKAEFHR